MLTKEEWGDMSLDRPEEEEKQGMRKEFEHLMSSLDKLAEKKQYDRCTGGDKVVVSVIKWNAAKEEMMIVEKGIELGNGTEEERSKYKDILKMREQLELTLERDQLKLSKRGRMVSAEKEWTQCRPDRARSDS